MKVSKQSLALLVFLAALMIYYNFSLIHEMTFDGSRHACNGHFFYDYFRTLLSGRFVGLPSFLSEYGQRGYNIGWYVLYDPPVFGIFQGFLFLLAGNLKSVPDLTSQFFAIFSVIMIYLISHKVFQSRNMALASAVLYGLLPFNYFNARTSYDPLPMISFTMAWFYFFFLKEMRCLKLSFGRISFSVRLNVIIASCMFTLAVFTKYTVAIHVALFIFLYSLWKLASFLRENDRSLKSLAHSEFGQLIKNMLVLSMIFFLLGWWWLKFQLIDNSMSERMLWIMGNAWHQYGYPVDWPYLHLSGLLEQVTYIPMTLLYYSAFLLPIALLPAFLRKKTVCPLLVLLLLFVVSVYFSGTFIFKDHKFRYHAIMLPFVFVLVMNGVSSLAGYSTRFLGKRALVVIVILCCLPVFAVNSQIRKFQLADWGERSDQLLEYFGQKEDQKLVVNVKGYGPREGGYYHSPDLFVFSMMLINKNFDPLKMQQYVQYVEWYYAEPQYEELAQQFLSNSKSLPVYVVMYKYEPEDHKHEKLGLELMSLGFSRKNLTYYYVYEKSP